MARFSIKTILAALILCLAGIGAVQARTSEVEPDGTHEEDDNQMYQRQLCVDHCGDLLNICLETATSYWETRTESAKRTYATYAGKKSEWKTYMSTSLAAKLLEIANQYSDTQAECSGDYSDCVGSCDY